MYYSPIDPQQQAELRSRAASRLTGAARTKGHPARTADALAVLYALASSPTTAADALALLHELQVLQVELDLQAEELRESRTELESALRRQVELYDFQPVGCLTVDRSLVIFELNRVGADLLGIEREAARGLGLDGFLAVESVRALHESIAGVENGATRASAVLRLPRKDGAEQTVRARIGADPSGQRFLLVLTESDETRQGASTPRS